MPLGLDWSHINNDSEPYLDGAALLGNAADPCDGGWLYDDGFCSACPIGGNGSSGTLWNSSAASSSTSMWSNKLSSAT